MTTSPPVTARVTFREPVSGAGFVDAAWWPRTLDLAVELPELLEVLWTAGRQITRLTYNAAAWDAAPRRIQFRGNNVHLGSFVSSDPITVRLSDAWGRERIDVLVVAPDTAPDVAARALELAGRADGVQRPGEILAEAGSSA